MDKSIVLWGAALVAAWYLSEKQDAGCKQCGTFLPLLQALRTSVCPQCERALSVARHFA